MSRVKNEEWMREKRKNEKKTFNRCAQWRTADYMYICAVFTIYKCLVTSWYVYGGGGGSERAIDWLTELKQCMYWHVCTFRSSVVCDENNVVDGYGSDDDNDITTTRRKLSERIVHVHRAQCIIGLEFKLLFVSSSTYHSIRNSKVVFAPWIPHV